MKNNVTPGQLQNAQRQVLHYTSDAKALSGVASLLDCCLNGLANGIPEHHAGTKLKRLRIPPQAFG